MAQMQGQPLKAARIFGAAEALRVASAAPLWPVERVHHDRRVAALRATLGEAAFAAAWAAGRALPLAQAVDYALEEAHPECHP
jgi:hypothetical protein